MPGLRPPDDEGFIEVEGGRVWWYSVGEGGVPLRPRAGDGARGPRSGAAAPVRQLVGGMLAMEYVLNHQPPLESLILCGSPASMPRWIRECSELLRQLPPEDREEIERHEREGWYGCPEYQKAVLTFYRRHVCKLDPWPIGWERSLVEAGYDVYNTMNGPTEFTVIGNFKDWDVTERLGEIRVPTLILGGDDDEARPAHMQVMHRRIEGSRIRIFDDAAHLCFWEHREEFMTVVNGFLDDVEAKT